MIKSTKKSQDKKIENFKKVKDVPLDVGKLYEYVCKWQRPLMQKPRGKYISTWSNSMISPGDIFMLIDKLPKTISYLKICVVGTGRIGWLYTGFTNGWVNNHKNDSLSNIIKKVI
jgi:hypothetical protein